ncbi:MAG: enoyl-CoA hydratase/isomerase family protein [Proteobacteria bacterium]|nr:enoyl-CoA hydratase/isomerase family protein [Pseudomonadota bacterium]MBU2227874.1 enoyl-CoA hydratase/isomerase family protein [Pseudomonadota bacterium]MBU2263008.1 enoyl-CoA hydratase/isomerase family protein [Pseudomonadota bacterium]
MTYRTIIVDPKEGYSKVTLNRPGEMNAISLEMRRELEECFNSLEADAAVRAIILTGGDYVFCAGMDLKEMSALPDSEITDYFRGISRYLKQIAGCRKPVIAAVGGIALGGGFNLATACDLIVASESAIFGHPELKFGLNPLFNPLRQIVGMAKAKELTMIGEPIAAKEALRIGLVNKVAPPEKMMAVAESIARELAARLPSAIEAVKRISAIVPRLDMGSALDLEMDMEALLFSSEERKGYMKEFLAALKNRKRSQELF